MAVFGGIQKSQAFPRACKQQGPTILIPIQGHSGKLFSLLVSMVQVLPSTITKNIVTTVSIATKLLTHNALLFQEKRI